jgi:hypothetical protein
LHPQDSHIVAVAADPPGRVRGPLPELPLNDAAVVATFIERAATAWPRAD